MFDLKSFSDDRLVDWMKEFVTKLKSHASTLGVSNSEVESVDHDYSSISGLVTEEKRLNQRNVEPHIKHEYIEYKELVKNGPSDDLKTKFPSVFTSTATKAAPGVIPRLQQFIESLTHRTGFSPDMAQKLGIAGISADTVKEAMANQGQFTEWFGNFINGIKENKTQLNVSDSELKSLESDYQASHHLVRSTDDAERQGASGDMLSKLMSYKDMIVNGPSDGLKGAAPGILGMLAAPGILPRVTGLINQLKGKPRFDEIMGKDLGITEAARPTAERMREPVGTGTSRGAGYGAGPQGARAATEGSSIWRWLLPLLILAGLAWFVWSMSARQGQRAARTTQPTPKVSAPAPKGAGPAKTKPKAATTAPLTISDVRYQSGTNGGVLTWTTNRPASSQIEYGTTSSYEKGMVPKTVNMSEKYLVTKHNLGMQGLRPGTKYYVKVMSQDKSGKKATSKPYSFTVP